MAEETIRIDANDDEELNDALPDWSVLNSNSSTVNIKDEVIPRRSEKDADLDGSVHQSEAVNLARLLMYHALEHPRGHHEKLFLPGVWCSKENRTLVPHAKGGFFKDIGYAHNYKNKKRLQGLWLNPIETIYLVERGSLILYLADDAFADFIDNDEPLFDYSTLLQLTLSHAYSLAFSSDSSLLNRYQVYALLKRLGYIVRTFEEYFPQEDTPPPSPSQKSPWSFASFTNFFTSLGFHARSLTSLGVSHFTSYLQVYRALQLIPSRRALEGQSQMSLAAPHYTIDFNVWKPQDFSKKNPPMPQWQVCVVNIAKQDFPSIGSIIDLWNRINFLFSLETNSRQSQKKAGQPNKQNKMTSKKDKKIQARKEREQKMDPNVVRKNNYRRLRDEILKNGTSGRSIVVAAIDNGVINFSNLGETEFNLTSDITTTKLDELEHKESHGLMWEEPSRPL